MTNAKEKFIAAKILTDSFNIETKEEARTYLRLQQSLHKAVTPKALQIKLRAKIDDLEEVQKDNYIHERMAYDLNRLKGVRDKIETCMEILNGKKKK
ncbi:hypothetical protein [Priestia megaterium]|uniref:hypothetical protein n=1 Tax=Priestia megaterium TaxID=1404 RepID=UPI0023DB6AFD|nr:hypothetical protein [Priestia megaterium]MDF2010217.1 hypothetical protein [Priestia megaterium]